MHSLATILVLWLLPLTAIAHMEMSSPYPINSNLDSAVPDGLKDYSYTSPLDADGSNFPCKGYQTGYSTSYISKANYTAGQTYDMSLTGSATHGGGSCQISLSYDNGATFKVIKSMIGGCPLQSNYTFTIPSYAPSSTEALLAWSWFNEIGNREMYMDCARVTIAGTTSAKFRRSLWARQDSMDSLPDMFVCNVGNGCTTIEEEDVQFPSPGSTVVYGTDDYATVSGSGYSTSGVASTATTASTTHTTTAATETTSTASSTLAATTATTAKLATTSSTVANPTTQATTSTVAVTTSTTSSSSTSSTALSGSCTVGEYACNSETTFSQCIENADGSTSYLYRGSVASGMECVDGTFVAQNSGSCSTNGAIVCGSTGYTWYMCDNGGLVSMGSVASGTKCVDGAIVADS